MEFSRQVYWSGILEYFLFQGNLPNPGIESASLVSPALVGRFFTTMPPGKPHIIKKNNARGEKELETLGKKLLSQIGNLNII